jgi:hypothetical protein
MSMEKDIEFKWLSFLKEGFNEMAANGGVPLCLIQAGR